LRSTFRWRLYLTPPPEMETSEELTEMPPDSTQVVEIVPLLKDFVAAVDLHGIWLAVHPIYDKERDRLHDPLSKMIVGYQSVSQDAGLDELWVAVCGGD
jgi:hypothetical protein